MMLSYIIIKVPSALHLARNLLIILAVTKINRKKNRINKRKRRGRKSPENKMIGIEEKQKGKVLTTRQKALFVKYYPVIDKIVNSMKTKLPAYADYDELHSAGVTGLADAICKLDPSRSGSYAGYISTRVRGAIIDELRSLDYMSRSARSDAKQLDKLREELEQKLGRAPKDSELREKMGVSEKQFERIKRRTQSCSFISLNDSPENDDGNVPSFAESIADENAETAVDAVEKKELAENVRRSIAALPEKQRRVIENYYFKDKKLGEIAKEFGLTEARICQIHAQALNSLRPKFVN